MGINNVDQLVHIVPIRITTTDTSTFSTPCINMALYNKVEFIVHFGTCSGDSFVLTACQSTATTMTGSHAFACRYRMAAAAGTDTMGDVTALASTGLTLTYGTFTLTTLIVDIDSSDLIGYDAHQYAGLTFTDPGSASAVNTIIALCWPKYPKETNAGALT